MKPQKVYFPADFSGKEEHSLKPLFPDDEVYVRKATLVRLLRAKIKACKKIRDEASDPRDKMEYMTVVSCFEEVLCDLKNLTRKPR